MTQYVDLTKTEGCIGLLAENGETIVLTGVSVNSMPLSVKEREGELYADFAAKYGIHFIFDDDIPEIDFYSVPRLDIGARDNDGGFIASVGEPFSLRDPVPLIYISADRKCYLLTKDATEFLSIVSNWKVKLTPYDAVTLYPSKDDARKDYQIIDFEKTEQYQKLREMMKK